jgi:hypothetical protein
MRKYWLLAGALLALGAAIVALPAWADSKDEPAGPLASSQRAHAAVPKGSIVPFSAEEARRQRERLAELTTCLRERGADIPGFNVDAGGVAIMLPPAAADRALREVAEECGLPAPPTHADFAEQRNELEARRAHLGDRLAQCLPRARLRPLQRP